MVVERDPGHGVDVRGEEDDGNRPVVVEVGRQPQHPVGERLHAAVAVVRLHRAGVVHHQVDGGPLAVEPVPVHGRPGALVEADQRGALSSTLVRLIAATRGSLPECAELTQMLRVCHPDERQPPYPVPHETNRRSPPRRCTAVRDNGMSVRRVGRLPWSRRQARGGRLAGRGGHARRPGEEGARPADRGERRERDARLARARTATSRTSATARATRPGIIGFCTGTHDLLTLVEDYTKEHPDNALAPTFPRCARSTARTRTRVSTRASRRPGSRNPRSPPSARHRTRTRPRLLRTGRAARRPRRAGRSASSSTTTRWSTTAPATTRSARAARRRPEGGRQPGGGRRREGVPGHVPRHPPRGDARQEPRA